jgi:hypothetical protein
MGLRRRVALAALLAAGCVLVPAIGTAEAHVSGVNITVVDTRAAAQLAAPSIRHRKAIRHHARRAHRAGIVRRAAHRVCRRHRKCRHRPAPPSEALAPQEQAPIVAAPAPLPASIVDSAHLIVRDLDGDIVELEKDIPIILSVATTLRGFCVEHAVSIVEVRDLATGHISYRLVPGALDKRTRESAELAQITLAANERLVADLHSHPLVRASSRDFGEIAFARRATQANFYPGVEDYGAMVKRGVVSVIVDPDGGVVLLRRIAGAPNLRKIEGAPLRALDEIAASRLELSYLYAQGYLAAGDWVRPTVAISLHAGP